MPEEFLQFIWEQKLFNLDRLSTTSGEPVEVLHQGTRNNDAGPDFFNARIRIGNTTWAGNVEIHRKASDWNLHNHVADKFYENIILHVVEDADQPVFRISGEEIPVLVLEYPQHLRRNYGKLLASKTWIPCQNEFHHIDPLALKIGFNRLLIGRLEGRTGEILCRLTENKNDWSETFYQLLARMFGFRINSLPMEMVSKSLPLAILLKHRDSLFQIESLLFGQAGFLNDRLFGDDYYLSLRKEYAFLSRKHHLKEINPVLWKFMRMRPLNFPTVRLAQFASLIFHSDGLLSKVLEAVNPAGLRSLFSHPPSEYWNDHFLFNKPVSPSPKIMGEESINLIIMNVVVPFLFVYGEMMSKNGLKDQALDYLDQLPPENNAVIRKWRELGVQPVSAFDTQSLLELKNRWCDMKKCLHCHIGNKLIRTA